MKKLYGCIKRRNLHCTIALLLLFALLVPQARAADKPAINVEPEHIDVDIGEIFTVNITATNWGEPSLWGYELKVYYDNTKLECLKVEIPEDHFLKPEDPTAMWLVMAKLINQTGGFASIAGIMTAPEPPHTGSGILASIQFNGTALGECTLEIRDVICVDVDPDTWISSQVPPDEFDLNSGSATVIPEFPAILIAPLMIIATLAAVILGKTAWSKKHCGQAVAK